MSKCQKCNEELIKDLNAYAYGNNKVEITGKKKMPFQRRASVKAAVCPKCYEVTFSIDPQDLRLLLM